MYSSRLEVLSSRFDRGTLQLFRTKDHSSRPEGWRADSTRLTKMWQAVRADSKTCEPTRSEEQMCAQKGEPTLITRSRLEALSELTRRRPSRLENHTQASNGYIFSLFSNWKFSNGYLSSLNGQEASKVSLKGKKAPLEDKKGGRKKRKGIALQSKPIFHQKPKESQGEPKAAIISLTKIKRPLGEIKKIIWS